MSALQSAVAPNEELRDLPTSIVESLNGHSIAVLASVCSAGAPTTTTVSWIVAGDNNRLAVALDRRARAFQNIVHEPRVAVEVFAGDAVYVVRGRARVAQHLVAQAPFPCAAVVIDIDEIQSHSVPGVTIEPPYCSYWPSKDHYRYTELAVVSVLRSLLTST